MSVGRYEFNSWTYDGEEIDEEDVIDIVTSRTARSDVTLVAKYTPIEYEIKYHLNGGFVHYSNKTSYTIEDEVNFNNAYRFGFRFIGWYLEDGTHLLKINKGTTGDIELFAQYTLEPYTVSFDVDGGTFVDNVYLGYNDLVPVPPSPKKEDDELYRYTFIGWYKEEERINLFDFETERIKGSITLYAKYDKRDIKYEHVDDFINDYMHPEIDITDKESEGGR